MKEESSALIDEILEQFYSALKVDPNIPDHIAELLEKHFNSQSSITPDELNSIYTSILEEL